MEEEGFQHIVVFHRSAILNDVAASSSRNRPQVTKTLLVLGRDE